MITKEENTYRTGVQKLVECCDENLFASEYQQDQGISNRLPEEYLFTRPLQIKGQMVETVHQCKYLGTILNDKLDWTKNSTMLLKNGNQRLCFLKSLKSFRAKPDLLKAFY